MPANQDAQWIRDQQVNNDGSNSGQAYEYTGLIKPGESEPFGIPGTLINIFVGDTSVANGKSGVAKTVTLQVSDSNGGWVDTTATVDTSSAQNDWVMIGSDSFNSVLGSTGHKNAFRLSAGVDEATGIDFVVRSRIG